MDWKTLLQNIVIFTVFSGLLTWLIQSLGNHYINKKFLSYEKQLELKSKEYQLELDQRLDKYRKELEILQEKRLKLHDLRIEIITQVYEKVVILNRNMKEMTALLKSVENDFEVEEMERIRKSGESFNDFLAYYSNKKNILQ